jgi:hypothetical protein
VGKKNKIKKIKKNKSSFLENSFDLRPSKTAFIASLSQQVIEKC